MDNAEPVQVRKWSLCSFRSDHDVHEPNDADFGLSADQLDELLAVHESLHEQHARSEMSRARTLTSSSLDASSGSDSDYGLSARQLQQLEEACHRAQVREPATHDGAALVSPSATEDKDKDMERQLQKGEMRRLKRRYAMVLRQGTPASRPRAKSEPGDDQKAQQWAWQGSGNSGATSTFCGMMSTHVEENQKILPSIVAGSPSKCKLPPLPDGATQMCSAERTASKSASFSSASISRCVSAGSSVGYLDLTPSEQRGAKNGDTAQLACGRNISNRKLRRLTQALDASFRSATASDIRADSPETQRGFTKRSSRSDFRRTASFPLPRDHRSTTTGLARPLHGSAAAEWSPPPTGDDSRSSSSRQRPLESPALQRLERALQELHRARLQAELALEELQRELGDESLQSEALRSLKLASDSLSSGEVVLQGAGRRTPMGSLQALDSCRTKTFMDGQISTASSLSSATRRAPRVMTVESFEGSANILKFKDADGDCICLERDRRSVRCSVKGELWALGTPTLDTESGGLQMIEGRGKHPNMRVRVPTAAQEHVKSFIKKCSDAAEQETEKQDSLPVTEAMDSHWQMMTFLCDDDDATESCSGALTSPGENLTTAAEQRPRKLTGSVSIIKDEDGIFIFVDGEGKTVHLMPLSDVVGVVHCNINGERWVTGQPVLETPDDEERAPQLRFDDADGREPHVRIPIPRLLQLRLAAYVDEVASGQSRMQLTTPVSSSFQLGAPQQASYASSRPSSLRVPLGSTTRSRTRTPSPKDSPRASLRSHEEEAPPEGRDDERACDPEHGGVRRTVLKFVFGRRVAVKLGFMCRKLPTPAEQEQRRPLTEGS
eukprot:TRINITY_DN7035_c0_g1_i9.p1 TRINITY_DN7035_c0_g1~~TRINITY_DN7035_c0_g1_i9.p1  ORF type:complete len:839 (+),score=142.17 TRINITY_DN7035_c0_g1_i9:95-2611(+)